MFKTRRNVLLLIIAIVILVLVVNSALGLYLLNR